MNKPVSVTLVIVVALILTAVVFAKLTGRLPGQQSPSDAVHSAVGSIRSGEEISPHFVAAITKLDADSFKIRITPQNRMRTTYTCTRRARE